MDDSKHKAKTEAAEGKSLQSTEKAVGLEASLKMTAEAFAVSIYNHLTGKDDLITNELKNGGLHRSSNGTEANTTLVRTSNDGNRLSNNAESLTSVPSLSDRLGSKPSESQQALINSYKGESAKSDTRIAAGTIEASGTAVAGSKMDTAASVTASADSRARLTQDRSETQVQPERATTSGSLLDQLQNCEVKRGACSIEEAKQNGYSFDSQKTQTASISANLDQGARKNETSPLIEQLNSGNNKVGPCTVEEAKQQGFNIDSLKTQAGAAKVETPSLIDQLNSGKGRVGPCTVEEARQQGFNPDARIQPTISDQINRSSKGDSLTVSKDDTSKQIDRTNPGPSLLEQIQSGNSKVGNCTLEEAKQNGFQIGTPRTEAKPEDGAKLQDRIDATKPEPSPFKTDFSRIDPNVRPDPGFRTTEVAKTTPAPEMRINTQTEKPSGGVFDQLNGYSGKTGACSLDEAKQNGSLPGARADFSQAKTNDVARFDYKTADARTSDAPRLADFATTKAPDVRSQVGPEVAGNLPSFKSNDVSRDVSTKDTGFRDTTSGGRVDMAARNENTAGSQNFRGDSRVDTSSGSGRDYSREASAGREPVSNTFAASRDLSITDNRQYSTVSNDRIGANTIEIAKSQSIPEVSRVSAVDNSVTRVSEIASKASVDADVSRAKVLEIAAAAGINLPAGDKSNQIIAGLGRDFSMPAFARMSTGTEADLSLSKAISLSNISGSDKVSLIAAEKNISAMLGITSSEKTATSNTLSIGDRSVLSTVLSADKAALSVNPNTGERISSAAEKGSVSVAGLQEKASINNAALSTEGGKGIVRAEDGTILSARKDGNIVLSEKTLAQNELAAGKLQGNLDAMNGGKLVTEAALVAHKTGELVGSKVSGEKVEGVVLDAKGRPIDIATMTAKTDALGLNGVPQSELSHLEYEDGVDENGLPIRRIKEFKGEAKRYLTGVELTIAAVIAMGGAAKVRNELMLVDPETGEQIGTVGSNVDGHKILHRRTHMVGEGETLQSIAENLYQNQAIAWLIADLNSTNIREENIDGKRVVEIKSRQTLELPEPEEVTKFLNTLQRDFNIDNLVTVVSETTIDRELLDSYLGTVSGGTSEQEVTAPVVAKPARKSQKPEKMKLPELVIGGLFGNHQDMPVANANRIRNNQQDIPVTSAAKGRVNHQDMPITATVPQRANHQDMPVAAGIPARNNHQDMPVAAGVPARINHQDMPISAGISGVVKDITIKIGQLVKRPISNKLRPV